MTDYEERYLALRDENTALKKKKNEQEATIKRMYTKLAMIEETMKKKRIEDGGNQEDPETGGRGKRDIDTEQFIHTLKTENAQLRKRNQSLLEKNRQLEERIRVHQSKHHGHSKAPVSTTSKSNLPSSKRPTGVDGKVHHLKVVGSANHSSFPGRTVERQVELAKRSLRDNTSADLEMALKSRLVVAEKQVVQLQRENEILRSHASSTRKQSTGRQGNNQSVNDEDEDTAVEDHSNDLTNQHLRRELRDRQAQIAILNARYEHLEANAAAEREIQEKTLEQLEQMNRQIHKLRTQLQDVRLEKQDLEIQAAKANELEREAKLLREQNRKLEERMTSLCESPFINDAFQRKERIDKLFDLEKLTQQQQASLNHMTEENHKLQAAVKELQNNAKMIKQAKDMVEQDLENLRRQLSEERLARQLMAQTVMPSATAAKPPSPKISLPSPVMRSLPELRDASSSPLKSEQHQSTRSPPVSSSVHVVTRKYFESNDSSLIETVPLEGNNNVKHLRNRLHVIQLAHLKSIQELERCEKMLHAQTNINRELTLEVEELTLKKVSSTNALQKRMKELELIADERQQRIQQMEAQIRQLKYARETLARKHVHELSDGDSDVSSDSETNEVASVSESLVLAARDLIPGEQLLEVWIVSASFDRTIITTNSSTFVLCDFYDFESQSTPLLIGSKPEYNFSSTFKVTVDAFFLRYLASESLVFEIHQAIRGDFRLVGRSCISLTGLLNSKGVIKESALPIKLLQGEHADAVVGTLNVIVRLAAPISEIWRLHLRSYPQDAQLLKKRDPVYAMDESGVVDSINSIQEALVNELQVTIFACRELRSYGKKKGAPSNVSTAPSSYVHYQILAFPDVFTNIVPASKSPEFDLTISKQYFAVEIDACLLRFFSKFRLWFTAFDDSVEVGDGGTCDGVIGRCGIQLEDLVKGESIRGWFDLKDRNDQYAGQISLLIEWKDPFQIAQLYSSHRTIGDGRLISDLHALDYDQQHAVMCMFSPQLDGRVNYRQFLYYTVPPESLEVVVAKIKERLEYAIDTEQIQDVNDIFLKATSQTDGVSVISSVDLQKVLEQYGAFLAAHELDTLHRAFSMAPSGHKETDILNVHFMTLHFNPRLRCTQRLLLHKLKTTMRIFLRPDAYSKSAPLSPAVPFEKYDATNSGYVSRAEFKRCLAVLGFELLNIDKEFKSLIGMNTPASTLPSDKTLDDPHLVAASSNDKPVNLDEETLQQDATRSNKGKDPQTVARLKTYRTQQPVSGEDAKIAETPAHTATDEFEHRKQVFRERIKAIASSSSRSLVYEQISRMKEVQREETNTRFDAMSSKSVASKLADMHVPQQLHHDAARILQRQYRMRRASKRNAEPTGQTTDSSLLEVDMELQSILKSWACEELEQLGTDLMDIIHREIPQATKCPTITRKQFGFALSKIPRVAFSPETLKRLLDAFTLQRLKGVTKIAYRPLVRFLRSVSTEPTTTRLPVIRLLENAIVDTKYAKELFEEVGDVNATGRISIAGFRETIQRIGIRLESKDFRVLVALLCHNGIDLLYYGLLRILRASPNSATLAQAIGRCKRYGISNLRDELLKRLTLDECFVKRDEFSRILARICSDSVQFGPRDAQILFDLACSFVVQRQPDQIDKVSLEHLLNTIQRVTQHSDLMEREVNMYDFDKLQHLAWNSRKLTCVKLSTMLEQFERFDWRETGLVSVNEFSAVVARVGFKMFSNDELINIAKKFGTHCHGIFGVNYRQFLDWTNPTELVAIEDVELKLRQYASQQAENSKSRQIVGVLDAWRRAFAKRDSNDKGVINRSNFAKTAIEDLHLPLKATELHVVLSSYDRSANDEVDYAAFTQLNWKESCKKQVQFEHDSVINQGTIKTTVKHIRSTLDKNGVTLKTITDALEELGVAGNDVDRTSFVLLMKRLGVTIAPDQVSKVFDAYKPRADRPHLNVIQFMCTNLGVTPPSRCLQKPLPMADEHRLSVAVESALKYSPREFEKAISDFREFCVVQDFRDLPPNRVWKFMDRIGMTSLLSKRAAGLLIQRFSQATDEVSSTDDKSTDFNRVSIGGILSFLTTVASNVHKNGGRERPNEINIVRPSNDSHEPLAGVQELVQVMESQGLDLRAVFESVDQTYTGIVPGLVMKELLLKAGLTKFVPSSTTVDRVIGYVVRQYRLNTHPDGIDYVSFLRHVYKLESIQADIAEIGETLRSRIRQKSGFCGPVSISSDVSNTTKPIDAAFAHFDRANRGFLTYDDLSIGLKALQISFSQPQLCNLLHYIRVFRHGDNNGGLSRMEFDAFVVDPYANYMLGTIASRIFAPEAADTTMPRIARLSRYFIQKDEPKHEGILACSVALGGIEEVLRMPIPPRTRARLMVLFDINRDGKFAYKLFLKVMTQWRDSTLTEENASASVPQQPICAPSRCTREDLVKSLYHQLSSVDFDSQIDLLREYCGREDEEHTGRVLITAFTHILDKIGVRLSPDALDTLVESFGHVSSNTIVYTNLVQWVKRLHKT